jgi:DNA/RNA-binding domain of Phe-tRNA-synthetase-like protein
MTVELRAEGVPVRAGVVIAKGASVGPTPPGLAAMLDELIATRAAQEFPPSALKDAVRDMLRSPTFKPTGRNKPAGEYLAQAAREGRFPRINNLVDINNYLSLKSGLPISMLDVAAVGVHAELRLGRAGERYVFNTAGQEIELEGLLCVCGGPERAPLGNAIKDSMTGKLKPDTAGIVAVVYAPRDAVDAPAIRSLLDEFAALLREHAGATDVETQVLG